MHYSTVTTAFYTRCSIQQNNKKIHAQLFFVCVETKALAQCTWAHADMSPGCKLRSVTLHSIYISIYIHIYLQKQASNQVCTCHAYYSQMFTIRLAEPDIEEKLHNGWYTLVSYYSFISTAYCITFYKVHRLINFISSDILLVYLLI